MGGRLTRDGKEDGPFPEDEVLWGQLCRWFLPRVVFRLVEEQCFQLCLSDNTILPFPLDIHGRFFLRITEGLSVVTPISRTINILLKEFPSPGGNEWQAQFITFFIQRRSWQSGNLWVQRQGLEEVCKKTQDGWKLWPLFVFRIGWEKKMFCQIQSPKINKSQTRGGELGCWWDFNTLAFQRKNTWLLLYLVC